MSQELKNAFARLTQASWDRGWISGRLGRLNSDGSYTITVSDKPGWVHVRLGPNGEQGNTIALNAGAPLHRNIPIRMRRENKILVIHGRDRSSGFNAGGSGSDIGPHATTHDRLGPDPLFITGPAFLPFMARPTSPASMAVRVMQGFYRYDGTLEVWDTAESSDLSAYIPASGQQHFVVVSFNRYTGALEITDGETVASNASAAPFGTSTVLNVADDLSGDHLPIAAIRFYNGQTAIRNADIFMDLRPWGGELFTLAGSSAAGGWTVDYSAIIPANKDAFIPGRVLIEDTGTLTVEGELYIV